MCHHAGTMHKVAWRHFRHAVYTRIHVYASGHEKVSSGNLGSGTLADKTPAHWPRPTENWWSDPQSELLDWQNPETGPKLSADPRSRVFFKSASPRDLSPKSTICELFKAKTADPRTYSPPSVKEQRELGMCLQKRQIATQNKYHWLTAWKVVLWWVNLLSVDEDKVHCIESNTRDQAVSGQWKKECTYRFTTSNFHLISKR